MPPTNPQRRRLLADAAIELLVASGVHGVTHRAVERRAGLPTGTTSNYFRTREDLLVAVAERVLELHQADMARAGAAHLATAPDTRGDLVAQVTDLLAASLYEAATVYRTRYLAMFELGLESLRRPALADAMCGLIQGTEQFTAAHHAELGLAVPREKVPVLMRMYGGALFTMVSGPPEGTTEEAARLLAAAVVRGVLGPG